MLTACAPYDVTPYDFLYILPADLMSLSFTAWYVFSWLFLHSRWQPLTPDLNYLLMTQMNYVTFCSLILYLAVSAPLSLYLGHRFPLGNVGFPSLEQH